ncbi:MAG: DUF2298 domain-containing protein [Anaerolineae bacterium]
MSQALLGLRWYFTLQLFGLAALPLTLRLFRRLPGRGYAFARPLGLLAGGWLFWLFSVFGWLPNAAGSVLVALGLLAAFGTALWLRSSEDAFSLPWRHVLIVEGLFAVAFIAWCLVRAHMPRIETAGGEKWMEIAFVNAILRAPRFPPHDPWLSGFAISYYYFGYLMMGMVIHLSAVPSTIAFNLGIAALFALTCTGSYGLLYALLAGEEKRWADWAGFLGPVLVTLTGNLEGLLEVFHARGLFSSSFWNWLDIRSINAPPPPLAEGSWVPTRFIWWWQASRVLHDYAPWHTRANPVEWEVIDEFPAFSFLLGDMHPHLLALPFVLLALALALALFFRGWKERNLRIWNLELPLSGWELLTYAVCLGGLGFLNTWDFPIYLFVVVAAFALTSYRRNSEVALLPLFALVLTLAFGGFLLYLPFWLGFRSQAAGIAPNLFNGTRLSHFLVMFGPLFFPVSWLVVAEALRRKVEGWEVVAWAVGGLVGLLAFLLLAGLLSPDSRQYFEAWRSGGPIPSLEHIPEASRLIAQRLRGRLLSPWTPLVLAALLTAAVLTLLKPQTASSGTPGSDAEAGNLSREALTAAGAYALLLVVAGGLLTLAVEFVYLRDVFGTRMNTVFKFYFQAWVMWAIAGAYGLTRLVRRGRWWAMAAGLVLIMGGLVYLPLAVVTRAQEYGGPPTLDGVAHLRQSRPADFAAIDWLNENVGGVPIILEAPGDHFKAYVYEGRVSAFTGLPTLLGWGGHQHQWRGNYEEPARREPEIGTLYTTTELTETLTLLDRYDIRYVYVGPLERSRYPAPGLAKFDQALEAVYSASGVTIYRYVPSPAEAPASEPESEQRRPGAVPRP